MSPLPTKRCDDCLNGKTMAELAMDSDGTLPKSRGQTPWAHFSRSIVPSDLLRELAESRPEALAFVAAKQKAAIVVVVSYVLTKVRQKREGPTECLITLLVIHVIRPSAIIAVERKIIFSAVSNVTRRTGSLGFTLGNGKACMPCYWSSKPCTNPDCPNEAGVPTKRCGGCRRSRYCSKECQIAMWPEHKKTCMGVVDVATETKEEEIAELGGSETTSNATERSISEFDGSETSSVYLESEASDDLDVSEASSNADAGGCSVS
eukprot:CAMPEP_0178502746 /NCGR_PEP_ID=MMETSP0696-20121128/17669_1 /TAXON_ID=265572 /ORGANISM="Extubocellulus spinifer, Strain CCMP396" /LENGTH=262 /DNA_ID=CAMNT_0020131825 /DNA_START=118 /DNA_END=906 /DNA_ORIENTATION=-